MEKKELEDELKKMKKVREDLQVILGTVSQQIQVINSLLDFADSSRDMIDDLNTRVGKLEKKYNGNDVMYL